MWFRYTRWMRPEIRHPDPASEFMTLEGCFILESWNDPSDPDVSVARARVAPGVTTLPHRLRGVDERYLILQGTGVVLIGEGVERPVTVGDIVLIPAGVSQQIRNSGDADLVFYCICSPRFTPECYESLA